MRLSLGSVGLLTAAVLIAFAFCPEPRAVRGLEKVRVREKLSADPPKAANAPKGKGLDGTSGGPSSGPRRPTRLLDADPVEPLTSSDVARASKLEARIREALNQPVDFTIEPQPLKDALSFIAARYQIPIAIDERALNEVRVRPNAEVRLAAPGVSLRNALKLLLASMCAPLSYEITHSVLMITSVEKINEHFETVVYDCRDLVGQGAFQIGSGATAAKPGPSENPKDRQAEFGAIARMVKSATGTVEDWERRRAPMGSILELDGLLIVRQQPRVQEEIKELFAAIRQM